MHAPAPATTRSHRAYPGRADQIAAVRGDLRPLLVGCPLADDVILCVSELAANAALHSNSRMPGHTFTVTVEIHPGNYAWIEVQDDGGPWHQPPGATERRHGLDIITSLATDWGIDGDYRSRAVWARIDWPAA
jgi:anti-sigma regulatory factor (Ser/Thr protein kinase)